MTDFYDAVFTFARQSTRLTGKAGGALLEENFEPGAPGAGATRARRAISAGSLRDQCAPRALTAGLCVAFATFGAFAARLGCGSTYTGFSSGMPL